MNKKLLYIVAVLVALLPIAYLIYLWPHLSATVPVHFGTDGLPDRYGNKSELLVISGIMTVTGLGVFLLLTNIQRIDPKKARNSPAMMTKIALAVLVFLSLLQLMIVESASRGTIKFHNLLLPLMGLFFAFLGNIFYSVKPNYFVGIRTPWALESDDNWRRTHQLAGKLWFAGGLVTAVLAILFPFQLGLILFLIITFIITIIPIVYSYNIYKNQH